MIVNLPDFLANIIDMYVHFRVAFVAKLPKPKAARC
ncbi:hypothetical protein DEV91_12852 [Phyllobacterium brassicacearum]|nr:hypothetical protein DEV91_12852 [Phyllobacterium brassicacearum]